LACTLWHGESVRGHARCVHRTRAATFWSEQTVTRARFFAALHESGTGSAPCSRAPAISPRRFPRGLTYGPNGFEVPSSSDPLVTALLRAAEPRGSEHVARTRP